MKRLLFVCTLLAILLTVSLMSPPTVTAGAPTPAPLDKTIHKQIDTLLSDYMTGKDHMPGMAVAVIETPAGAKSVQMSEFFYGTIKLGDNQRPTDKTIFGIGSETKVFTATLLAFFVQEGKVKLDDSIQKYLPGDVHAPTFAGKSITLLDLATHRSGLPDSPDNKGKGKNKTSPDNYTRKDLYDWLNSYQLTRAPGSQWEYSNIGFGLLGTILSSIANQNYDDLMRKYIDTPLAMPDTVVFLSDEQQTRAAQGYDGNGNPAAPMFDTSSVEVIGGGQLSSTLHDMENFMQANLDLMGDKTTLSGFDLTHKLYADAAGVDAKMGLGWQVAMPNAKAKNGFDVPRFWKDGEASGFHSFMSFLITKDKKIGIAMLGNGIASSSGFEPLGVQIMKLIDSNAK